MPSFNTGLPCAASDSISSMRMCTGFVLLCQLSVYLLHLPWSLPDIYTSAK